jgi:hypothetical protein
MDLRSIAVNLPTSLINQYPLRFQPNDNPAYKTTSNGSRESSFKLISHQLVEVCIQPRNFTPVDINLDLINRVLILLDLELLLVLLYLLKQRVQIFAPYDTLGVFGGYCFRAHPARLGLRFRTLDKLHSAHDDFGRCIRGVSSPPRAAAGGIDPAAAEICMPSTFCIPCGMSRVDMSATRNPSSVLKKQ